MHLTADVARACEVVLGKIIHLGHLIGMLILQTSNVGNITICLKRMKLNMVNMKPKMVSYGWLGESTTDSLS